MLFGVQVQNLLPGSDFQMAAYNPAMSKKFGKHLMELRLAAGLSQNDLATELKMRQSNISFWEKWDRPPRSDILPQLAAALGVSVDVLLGYKTPKKAVGKARQAFDAVSRLPRRQQDQIIKVVNALVAQHGTAKAA